MDNGYDTVSNYLSYTFPLFEDVGKLLIRSQNTKQLREISHMYHIFEVSRCWIQIENSFKFYQLCTYCMDIAFHIDKIRM